MGTVTKTTASGGTPAVADQKTRVGFTVIIVDLLPAGQCDCDAGIRWVHGQAQPCHKCQEGAKMYQCQQDSDFMEIYG